MQFRVFGYAETTRISARLGFEIQNDIQPSVVHHSADHNYFFK